MAQEPGLTRPLTQEETEAAFACAPVIHEDIARWTDSSGGKHRDNDLPAVVYADGSMIWWINNKVHRDGDLPAIVNVDGVRAWYNNGKRHRDNDLPAYDDGDGELIWFNNGNIHRGNGPPARIYSNGQMFWYTNGKCIGDQDNPPPGAVFPGQQTKSASKH